MSDDTQNTGKRDDVRINVHQPHEVTYWTSELNVTPKLLEKAVAAVGPMVKDVREWLNKNRE